MARPIKETPVLKGNEARRFSAAAERAFDEPVSPEARERMRANYKKVKAIEK
ncbi:MAG: hypothetical protein R2817_13000 [Flavobacteriales bacterium]